MRRIARFGILLLVVLMTSVLFAEAQTSSSLRGYVKDNQGGVLPGVTVTATSPDMITPSTGRHRRHGLLPLDQLATGRVHQSPRNWPGSRPTSAMGFCCARP